jgi:hypothetical protein
MTEKWIQNASPKKGALHRQVGYPESRKFTKEELERIAHSNRKGATFNNHTITPLMKHRANFALNIWRR